MLYNAPFDATDPNAAFVNGNPSTNTPGSIPPAEALEYPQREIVAVITGAGLTPTNSDLTQLYKAIQTIAAGSTPSIPSTSLVHAGADTSTTANQIVIPTITPAVTSLADYQLYEIVPNVSVTGATTLTIASNSALPLYRGDGSQLQSGDAPAGRPFLVMKLGSAFLRLSVAPSEYTSGASTAVTTVIQNNFVAGEYPHQYPTAGSYTLNVPAGQVFDIEECRGAGGGGGGSSGTNTAGTGGGGGGRATKVGRATQATVLGLVVGAGGAGGSAGGGNGGSGGTTQVTVQSGQVVDKNGTVYGAGATLCAATGGTGGAGSANGGPGSGGGAGGIASGGDLNDSGDGGGLAPYLGSYYFGGSGGRSPGAGGRPDDNFGAAGNISSAPGTGGNGSSANANGGNGHDGRITIRM